MDAKVLATSHRATQGVFNAQRYQHDNRAGTQGEKMCLLETVSAKTIRYKTKMFQVYLFLLNFNKSIAQI